MMPSPSTLTGNLPRPQLTLSLWLFLTLLAVGCTSVPGGSPSPSQVTYDVQSPSPPSEVTPQISNSVTQTDPPIQYPPDNVWAFLSTSAGTPSGADGLDRAAMIADLIVVGRFIGLEKGRAYGAPGEGPGWYAVALIDVESTERGNASVGDGGLLRVPFLLALGAPGTPEADYPEKEFADVSQSIPEDPALLFLSTWKSYFDRAETEVPDWLDGLDRSDIYRTIGADGAVRVVDGKLEPSPYAETWVADLEGMTLDGLRTALQQSGQSPSGDAALRD